jgi:hypothetical protein
MTSRRALVSFPDGVGKIIDNEIKGQIGDGDSEVIRNIVIAYLIEKGYLLKGNKQQNDQLAAEVDIHDIMITSLAGILEERGQLNHEEWEKNIQSKLHE